MARKRKLDTGGITPETVEPALEQGGEGGSKLGGFWAGSALNMLKARMEETHASVVSGIMQGTIALELDASQISDEVGTDRFGQWDKDPSFKELVADIESRGQKQAIRVRPVDADWTPNETSPLETNAKFVVQSGRRRLQALATLGRRVVAVVSTNVGDAARADLEERFKENTMRKNLSGFEELVSIGLIAESYKELSQEQVAQNLGVPQGDVSMGLSCVELFGEISLLVDVTTAAKRDFRKIIPAIRAGRDPRAAIDAKPTRVPSVAAPKTTIQAGGLSADVKPSKGGFALRVKGYDGSQEELEVLITIFLKTLGES